MGARALVLTIAAVAGLAAGASAQTEPDTLFCGTLTAYQQASATRTGSATIGTHVVRLAAEPVYSAHPGTQERLKVGTAICLSATFNAAGEAFQYLVNPLGSELCGAVVSFSAPSAAAEGTLRLRDLGLGTFAVRPGTDLGPAAFPPLACFRIAVGARGDAEVIGRVLTIADRTVARVAGICGLVTAWTGAVRDPSRAVLVHRDAGSIAIGTRTFAIAAGTEYSLVNAAPKVGETTCLSGALDASGALIEYAAQPGMPPCTGGQVAEYAAATPTAAGSIRLALAGVRADSYRFAIPAGTVLPADVASGGYCLELSLDPRGDAIVTGARVPPPGGAAGSSAPAPRTLPSTSTR